MLSGPVFFLTAATSVQSGIATKNTKRHKKGSRSHRGLLSSPRIQAQPGYESSRNESDGRSRISLASCPVSFSFFVTFCVFCGHCLLRPAGDRRAVSKRGVLYLVLQA